MSKVSILIPTFNQSPAFLRAALLSAKHQTHRCEIIIVDDGSDPRAEAVVEEVMTGYSDEDVQCKYVWQENKGVAGALNRALTEATGEWIRWLPSDDLFALSSTQTLLNHRPYEVGHPQKEDDPRIFYGGYEEGIPSSAKSIPAITFSTRERLFDALCRHCFINAASVMWHASVFEEIGNFNEQIVHAQDYEFLLRCAEKFNFLGVNDVLLRRRVHAGQMIQTLHDPAEKLKKQRDMEFLRERYGAGGHVWIPNE
jgi:glycosyltransferase involved in cell wall biosynthesis